jgi:hypothetical protein
MYDGAHIWLPMGSAATVSLQSSGMRSAMAGCVGEQCRAGARKSTPPAISLVQTGGRIQGLTAAARCSSGWRRQFLGYRPTSGATSDSPVHRAQAITGCGDRVGETSAPSEGALSKSNRSLEFAGASCIEISLPDQVFFAYKETLKGPVAKSSL